jgi:signal peptidase I
MQDMMASAGLALNPRAVTRRARHLSLRGWAGLTVVACLAGGAWAQPLRPGVVLGSSMTPTFHSGQVFLMSRSPAAAELSRGDVVVFRLRGETFIKRIVGLPGDTLSGIDWAPPDGKLDYVLEARQVGPMRKLLSRYRGLGRVVETRVPADHVFVVGDAANRSPDSRQLGPIPLEALQGRLLLPHSIAPASAIALPKTIARAD